MTEIPHIGERLEQHGPVVVLMACGKWAPGVPKEIRAKYEGERPAKTTKEKPHCRTVGAVGGRPRNTKHDAAIPRIIDMRYEGATWAGIAEAMKMDVSTARRLYTRGLAQRGMADYSWKGKR